MRFFAAKEGQRWVTPFPDQYPDFQMEIELHETREVMAAADRRGVNRNKPSLVRQYEASRDVVCRNLLGWRGEENLPAMKLSDDVTLFGGEKLPINEENKIRFDEKLFFERAVGDVYSWYAWCCKLVEEEGAIELKNS